jgi:plastocyanin
MQNREFRKSEFCGQDVSIGSIATRIVALVIVFVSYQVAVGQIAVATDAAQESPSSGTQVSVVSGNISVPTGGRRPDMVAYLTPVNDQQVLPLPASTVVVSQKGAEFSPSLVVVSVGQSVDFRNDEGRPIEHNVFSRSPVKPFDLGLFPPGEERRVTFNSPGVVRLYCSIHRYMDGVIYVCPTSLFAIVDDTGRYQIANVPEGEYDVHIWQRRQRYIDQTRRIMVSAGPAVSVDFELKRR